jgi:DNA-binding transcriptional LysR family regulator
VYRPQETRLVEQLLPNLRHLRAFCEVEGGKTISGAARAVALSQSAATQALAKLEALFGVAFFEHVGKSVAPTAVARAYATRVRRALALIEAGIGEALRGHSGRPPRPARETLALLTMTQLRAFVAVGTTGNLTWAARLVGSSQPSVHRSTRDLESAIGVLLYEKVTRGVALTRAGRALWQQVKLAFAELEQGVSDVRASQGQRLGTIVVGCMPLARHFVLPEAINAYCGDWPRTEVHVVESPYRDLLHGLRHGEIDFLVGALRHPPPVEDVLQEPLFRAALCVAARRGHPLARKRRLTTRDLARYPWVLPPAGAPTRERFERMMAEAPEVHQRGHVESSSQVLVRGLLLGSDRLTLISRQQIQFEIDVGQLVALDFGMSETLREIGLTFRSGWIPTAVQLEFLETLRAVARRHSE